MVAQGPLSGPAALDHIGGTQDEPQGRRAGPALPSRVPSFVMGRTKACRVPPCFCAPLKIELPDNLDVSGRSRTSIYHPECAAGNVGVDGICEVMPVPDVESISAQLEVKFLPDGERFG